MQKIPYDLLHPIFEVLKSDKSSLCVLSLCSSTFRNEAQCILFRDVTSLTTEIAHLRFMHTVTTSPDCLALLVRAYKIAIVRIPAGIVTLRNGLQAMRNLKHLVVYAFHYDLGPEGLVAIFHGIKFSLQCFEWMSHPSEAKELVEVFLYRQRDLKHLSLTFNDAISLETQRAINSTMCPHLISLRGSWDVLKAILPESNITTLETTDPLLRATDITSLVPSLQRITALMNVVDPSHSNGQERILRHCTSLTVLEVWQFHIEKILGMLSKLSTLHKLILSQYEWFEGRVKEEQRVICDIFDNSHKNLQLIDFQVEMETYVRYSRSQGASTAGQRVSRTEVRKLWLGE